MYHFSVPDFEILIIIDYIPKYFHNLKYISFLIIKY